MTEPRANYIDVVRRVIKDHPEINLDSDETRGKIVDYVAEDLNPLGARVPWGRKSRNKEGTDLNSDGLTELLPDGKFRIVDILIGSPQPVRELYATWDDKGIFAQGENGYWVPVGDETPENPEENETETNEIDELKALIREVQQENAFIKQQLADCIKAGDKIGLATNSHFFICAENEGYPEDKAQSSVLFKGNVNATRRNMGPWETLTVIKA